jgi:hypothetical protein
MGKGKVSDRSDEPSCLRYRPSGAPLFFNFPILFHTWRYLVFILLGALFLDGLFHTSLIIPY